MTSKHDSIRYRAFLLHVLLEYRVWPQQLTANPRCRSLLSITAARCCWTFRYIWLLNDYQTAGFPSGVSKALACEDVAVAHYHSSTCIKPDGITVKATQWKNMVSQHICGESEKACFAAVTWNEWLYGRLPQHFSVGWHKERLRRIIIKSGYWGIQELINWHFRRRRISLQIFIISLCSKTV